MRTPRRNGTRFTFSLNDILTVRHSRDKKLSKPRPRPRTFESHLRLPLALLNK